MVCQGALVLAGVVALAAGARPELAALRGGAGAAPRLLPACGGAWAPCHESRCCSAGGYTCYEKDTTYSQCQPTGSCVKGIHADDPSPTPWSCVVDGAERPGDGSGGSCSASFHSCQETRCCSEEGYTCYEKDDHYAQCQPTGSCAKGVHENDPVKTPWRCTTPASTTAEEASTTAAETTTASTTPASTTAEEASTTAAESTTASTTPASTTAKETSTTAAVTTTAGTTAEEATTSATTMSTTAEATTPASTTPGCVDLNQYCADWAAKGECEANPEYMLQFCKMACGACSKLDVSMAAPAAPAALAPAPAQALAPAPASALPLPLLGAAGSGSGRGGAASCGAPWGACLRSRCCTAGYTCYEKDSTFAQCRPDGQCAPGVHEDDHVQTPWSCKELGTRQPGTPPGSSCSASFKSCQDSRCCSDAGYTCYKKDTTYAQCQPTGSCLQGVHPGDPVQTPWSCTPATAPSQPAPPQPAEPAPSQPTEAPEAPPKANCADVNRSCAAWAAAGECQNNPAYMMHFCKASCDAC